MRRSKHLVVVLLLAAAGQSYAGRPVSEVPEAIEDRYQRVLVSGDLDGAASLQFAKDLNDLAQADPRTGFPKRVETMTRTLLSANAQKNLKGYATFENTLGIALAADGKLKDAASAFRDSLQLRERILEPSDLYIAESLNNLALVNRRLHHLKDSERDYRRAIEILRAAKRQPEIAASIHNLARVRAEQGHSGEAERLIQEAISLWEESLGPNHDDVAEGYSSLCVLHQSAHRYADAIRACRRAVEIFTQSRGPNDSRLVGLFERYSAVLRAQEEFAEAAKIDMQAMRIRVANSIR